MSLPLAKYCAYWFVKRRLGTSTDTEPPQDAPLTTPDPVALAFHIVDAVKDAELAAGPHLVDLDLEAFVLAAPGWRSVFDARDCMFDCARLDGVAELDPTAHALAFSDYIATRWIFREIWKFEIRRRPIDREFPAPFRNGDAKRGLAETLASNTRRVGLELKNTGAFLNASARWEWVSEARTALLNQVKESLRQVNE